MLYFLFDYYPYSVNRLRTWHPGHGTVLQGSVDRFLAHPDYIARNGGATPDAARLERHRKRLYISVRLLGDTSARAPEFGCFGMHEWAMVYRLPPDQVRHTSTPLRLTPAEIAEAVDGLGLRCTHLDAFRFFTPAAVPFNAHAPTRSEQHLWEQPGCLHANMDLYKYAMWFQPFMPSEVIADCFTLARQAREVDMRAAPYDLADLGYEPIPVETPEGRRAYVEHQRRIADQAQPLRARLLSWLRDLRALLA